MGIEKLLLGTFKKALKSGKAVGAEVKITDVTKMLKEHPKAIGEEIGNLLGGKGKKATDVLSSLGGFDKAFEEIDKVAQKYPEAVVKVGVKQSKQGFTVAKFAVTNGDKEIMSSATSVSGLKEGKPTVKSRFTRLKDNTEMRSYADGENIKISAKDNITAININGTMSPMNLSVNVGKNGEVARANIQRNVGNPSAKSLSYEVEDGMLSAHAKQNGFNVDLTADTNALRDISVAGYRKTKEEFVPLVIELLRPLRERFNTAIDLFRYNGRKNYEKFLSKEELEKSISELLKEKAEIVPKIEIGLKRQNITEELINTMKYDRQITSDINYANELIRVYC